MQPGGYNFCSQVALHVCTNTGTDTLYRGEYHPQAEPRLGVRQALFLIIILARGEEASGRLGTLDGIAALELIIDEYNLFCSEFLLICQ